MNSKSRWNPVQKQQIAAKNPPELFDIPFVTSENMRKLVFYPSGQTLNVPNSVEQICLLWVNIKTLLNQCQVPQKTAEKICFSQIFWFSFRPTKIF